MLEESIWLIDMFFDFPKKVIQCKLSTEVNYFELWNVLRGGDPKGAIFTFFMINQCKTQLMRKNALLSFLILCFYDVTQTPWCKQYIRICVILQLIKGLILAISCMNVYFVVKLGKVRLIVYNRVNQLFTGIIWRKTFQYPKLR